MAGTNPYHFIRKCLFGKWKMTILHSIHYYGAIRFSEVLLALPVSEKVLGEQLRELTEDGLVERIQYSTLPLKVKYVLTDLGKEMIPALDILYIWSVKRMHALGMEIDPATFDVHDIAPYSVELKDVYNSLNVGYEQDGNTGFTDADGNRS